MPRISPLPTRANTFGLTLLLLVGVLLAGCGGAPAAPTTTSVAPAAVSLQLSWTHEYSSAMFYAAEKNGHFAAQNLQVSLVEGGFNDQGYIQPIDEVVAGSSTFGLASATSLIEARAQGKPVVAIASVLQRSPLAIISLADRGIARPGDLIGRSVSVADGGALQMYHSILSSQGIDLAQVEVISRTSFGIDPLLSGEIDSLVAWVINEGVQVREAGREPTFILASDYGVDTYDFVIFTTEQVINERPAEVERFLRAVLQGIEDVIADPAQGAAYAVAYNPKLDQAGQEQRLNATIPLINPPGTRLGEMRPDIWEFTQQMMIGEGSLERPIDLNTVYTMAFLDKITRDR